MSKRLVIGLFAVIAGLIVWTEANAQTCKRWKNVAGSNVCVAWRPGSEICEVVVSGVNGSGVNMSPGCEGNTCPVVTCSVFGAEESESDGLTVTTFSGGGSGGGSDDEPCDTTLDPNNCGLTGTLTCRRPTIGLTTTKFLTHGSSCSKSDPNCKTFRNVSLSPEDVDFPLTEEKEGFAQCTTRFGGICRTSLNVDITQTEGNNACIEASDGQFTVFQRFVANRFNGEVVFCPGGYDLGGNGSSPQCCATSARTYGGYYCGEGNLNDGDANGVGDGFPTVITQRCTLVAGLFYVCNEREFEEPEPEPIP